MTKSSYILQTGLNGCYDTQGKKISCSGSGQDGEFNFGVTTTHPRFDTQGELVRDTLTGLVWPRSADIFTYPLTWEETLAEVARLNADNFLAHSDWRLPNRRELRSLVNHGARKPSLPDAHPFLNVFLGWYWTSTTSAMAPAYAWRVHFEGGRMFYGNKKDPGMAWPVRGTGTTLAQTGQKECFDVQGNTIDCDYGQDGALRMGVPWPTQRFESHEHGVLDTLTRLVWAPKADLAGLVDWQGALDSIHQLNRTSDITWRLPNINELESLVDASQASPALQKGHPFEGVQEAYWSSTTSYFETDWAYALYLHKGAVGVGYKQKKEFHCWPVAGPF